MIYISKKVLMLTLALAICLLSSAATPAVAENLLVNSGFEELDEKGAFARDWAMNPAYPGHLTLIENAAQSCRGSRCIKMEQTEKLFVALFQGRTIATADKRD